MPPVKHHVLLFGDQTDDVADSIRSLYLASKTSMLMPKFLRDASDVCQIEFGNLHQDFLDEVAPFESLLELAENHAKTDGSPVLASSILTYFSRLGELILRTEHDPTILSSPRVLIGLCVSVLPAALAATARSDTELARLSLEAFPSYFNWVVANHVRTKSIESQHGRWSCMIMKQHGVDLQSTLDGFHTDHDIPAHKRAWISVFSRRWTTVSAPPSILKLFIAQCIGPKKLHYQMLPVASAVHAPHLPVFDYDSTVKPSSIWNMPLQKGACIMSTAECAPYLNTTLGEVTRRMLDAVLRAPLMVDDTFTATAEYLKATCTTAAVSILGPSAQVFSLIRTLEESNISVEKLADRDWKPEFTPRSGSGAVAIVGMSARFPQAKDLDEFWQLLMEGRTTHEQIPFDRFNLHDFYDPEGKGRNMMMNTDACFLSNPGAFDHRMFRMSAREALQVDPTHRLLLMTSLEALEKAGYNPDVDVSSRNRRVAVYCGQNADVWRELSTERGIDMFTAPGLLRAFSPGRISHHFGFEGGSYSVDTACSSSATAIQLACDALVNRECDMALAAGAQVLSSPFEFAALGKSGFLAPCGGCKTFCADADGYCRGEAAGVLVLKRLEDAVMDNDNVEALITGWGRNYSSGAVYMTRPDVDSQKKLIHQVLRQSNVKSSDVDYVELHGTGTTVGDLAEMKSVTSIFNNQRKPHCPLHVGSLKANVGHSESAAGVSSAIKAVLMLRKGIIPPQAMITKETKLHPGFANLDLSSIRIDTTPAMLGSKQTRILVNSFDAAGGNTCFLIESAPKPKLNQTDLDPDPRNWHLVSVSAHTQASLLNNKKRLLEYLVKNPRTRLSDLAYSTTARRTHYAWRFQYVSESTKFLMEQLRRDILQSEQSVRSPAINPKTIFVFSGQGISYHGLATNLYKSHPTFRDYLNLLDQTCKALCPDMRCSVISILTGYPSGDGSFTAEQHTAIVCFQLALVDLWKSWGIQPDIVLGHSIGEYAALCVAGVMSVADTLWVVYNRAKLFETTHQEGKYGMLRLSASREHIANLLKRHQLDDTCQIACYNGRSCHVVGGLRMSLRTLEGKARAQGILTHTLSMSYAYHCKDVEPVATKLKNIAAKISFFPPKIAVAETVTGAIITTNAFNASHLSLHTSRPVQFRGALKSIDEYLSQNKASPIWLGIGPSSTGLALLRENMNVCGSQVLPSVQDGDTWMTLTKSLGKACAAGLRINWAKFHQPFKKSLKLLDLPTYAFDLENFWRAYTTTTAATNGISIGARQRGFVPTATVQMIQDEKVDPERIEVTFSSSLRNIQLRDAIQGHIVAGFPVCPASVFIDMALTAAAYMREMIQSQKGVAMGSIKLLELHNPFVLQQHTLDQTLEIRVLAEESDNWNIHVAFHSRSSTGDIHNHGSCQVVYNVKIKELEDNLQSFRTGMMELTNLEDGNEVFIHNFCTRDFYKMFSTTVEYGGRYRGVTTTFLPDHVVAGAVWNARAVVKLTPNPDGEGNAFMLNPYHSDSLVQLAGFMTNLTEKDNTDILHFACGIESVMVFEKLEEDETYVSIVNVSATPDGACQANILISRNNVPVGIIKGLKFRALGRDALKALFNKMTVNRGVRPPVLADVRCLQDRVEGHSVVFEAEAAPEVNSQGSMEDIFISALIAETGTNADDIEDDTNLSELGIDSLMAIAIVQNMRCKTGKPLPMSIVTDCLTIRDVKVGLRHLMDEVKQDPSRKVSQGQTCAVENGDENGNSLPNGPPSNMAERYKSKAVLLKGDAKSALSPLFFIAGSSGSASIYANLKSERPVWVLESPFLHCPSEMDYTPQEIAPVYIAAVKKIRPSGPYLLGGHSAGAVHAYETARLLLNHGDNVKKLILVDMKANVPGGSPIKSPQMDDMVYMRTALQEVPSSQARPESRLVDETDDESLFASLRCMSYWQPIPMDRHCRPSNGTVIIWARWGIHQTSECDVKGEKGVNPMAAENMDYESWFCGNRYTYDANGWDLLVGDVQTFVVDGNHWNMLQTPCVSDVSKLINQALVDCLEE